MCRFLLKVCVNRYVPNLLFAQQCDLSSELYDRVDPYIIRLMKTEEASLNEASIRLSNVLKYKHTGESLSEFFTMVHGSLSPSVRGLIGNVLDLYFNGADQSTDLASIIEAINSSVLFFLPATQGFIIKSLDQVNELGQTCTRSRFFSPKTMCICTSPRAVVKNTK
jgi:hypothetical protein